MTQAVWFVVACVFMFEIIAALPFVSGLFKDWLVRIVAMWLVAVVVFKIDLSRQIHAFFIFLGLMGIFMLVDASAYEALGNAAFAILLVITADWCRDIL